MSIADRRAQGQSQMHLSSHSAIPPHMRQPGEDGFRTPTGEDYQHSTDAQQNGSTAQSTSSGRDYFANSNVQAAHHSADSSNRGGSAHAKSPPPSQSSSDERGDHHRRGIAALGEKLTGHLHWKARIRHFTWAMFTVNMVTGGIANVLYAVPFRFRGIDTIGTVFFPFNLVLFLVNVVSICLRFAFYPETFRASLTHPTELLFMPACVVSFGTILINISQYGLGNAEPWLNTANMVLFWLYVAFAFLVSSLTYLLLWSTQTFTIQSMTPVWIFPAYPLLIVGPYAGVLASSLRPDRAFTIIIGGFTAQGIGFVISLMVYSAFMYRLMTQKLPSEGIRPGMFVSVGSSGFTCTAIINMATATEGIFAPTFMGDGEMAALILKVVGNFVALWFWGLALWFFAISVGAHWSSFHRGSLSSAMTWYSFVFPNTALITTTYAIGNAYDVYAINIVASAMTCILIAVWMYVFGMMIRAIIRKQILWPQKGEDRDEGGFRGPELKSGNTGHGYWEKSGHEDV